jgi:hypothetical protein
MNFPLTVAVALEHARLKHTTGIRSVHEALGVIEEEFEEFKREVFAQSFDKTKGRKELTHIAAMCQRAAEDLQL